MAVKSLKPPIDIPSVIRSYAALEYAPIPFDVDGLCLDLKVPGRTRVIINSGRALSRQKFTAAHELAHIIIPWHVGSIIDTDVYNADPAIESILYVEQEAEANRFASEILLPTDWIETLFNKSGNPVALMKELMDTTGVSPHAISIKLKDTLPSGLAFARYNGGKVDIVARTRGTIGEPPPIGTTEAPENVLRHAEHRWELRHGQEKYVWWQFGGQRPEVVPESDDWRETLNQIMEDIGLEEREQHWRSLSGLLAQANSKVLRNRTPDTIYDALVQKIEARSSIEFVRRLSAHPDFKHFLAQRAQSFASRE